MTREWFEKVAYHSLGWRTSQEMTYDIAKLALERGIPGDFCECGVYAGASSALMARAIMDLNDSRWGYWDGSDKPPRYLDNVPSSRRVHLFDSFTGIPAPGPHDHELAANKGGESACSLEDVQKNMREWGIPDELLVWHPGLFEDTVRAGPMGRLPWADLQSIAVLRLDGDLYESTKVCMEYLYPLVSPGGYVIVDDWNLSGCRKAVMETVMPAPVIFRKEQ